MQTKGANNKPFPVRLGEIKPILQREAASNERSLHYTIKKILKAYVENAAAVKTPVKK